MKKKHLITSVASIVGVVMLTVSAIATYATANGYSAAKNAAKNILTEDNLTLKANLKITVDGKEYENDGIIQKFDKNGLVKYNQQQISDFSSINHMNVVQDGMNISVYDRDSNGVVNAGDSVYVRDYSNDDIFDSIWLFEAKDSKEVQSGIRFMELLSDTLVGDLKNNIILTDSNDETDTYTLSLDAYQIPELYQAGFEMIMAANSAYISEDVNGMSEEEFYAEIEDDMYLMFEKEPKISNAEANISIDKDGRLRKATGVAVFEGKDHFDRTHTIEMSLDIDAYDYGSTVCERIDLSELKDTDIVDYSQYDYEERIKNIDESIEHLKEREPEDEDDKENIRLQLESYLEDRQRYEKVMESSDYLRYKEIMDSILFGSVSDEERGALVEEKSAILKSGRLDAWRDDIETEKPAAVSYETESVGVIGGADGPTEIVVSTPHGENDTVVTVVN